MRYFFVTDDGNLIPLADFAVTEGQSQMCVSLSSVELFTARLGEGRTGPDTFRMEAASMLPQVGRFRVVGEDCTVYGCVGGNTSIENGRLVVTGVVYDRFAVEEQHRAAALQMMQNA